MSAFYAHNIPFSMLKNLRSPIVRIPVKQQHSFFSVWLYWTSRLFCFHLCKAMSIPVIYDCSIGKCCPALHLIIRYVEDLDVCHFMDTTKLLNSGPHSHSQSLILRLRPSIFFLGSCIRSFLSFFHKGAMWTKRKCFLWNTVPYSTILYCSYCTVFNHTVWHLQQQPNDIRHWGYKEVKPGSLDFSCI